LASNRTRTNSRAGRSEHGSAEMAWEPTVLAIANTALVLPLLPTLKDTDAQVPRWTSIPTGTSLLAIGVAYYSLGLVLPSISSLLQTTCWMAIAVWRPVRTDE